MADKNKLRHELMNGFGQRLMWSMEYRGLNQLQLSYQVSVSQPQIGYYLKGSSFPRLEVIQQLAIVLQVSYDWLKTGVGDRIIPIDQIRSSCQSSFAERMIWLLWTNGSSAAKLAPMMNCSYVAITNWCEGSRYPSMENLERVCRIFNVEYRWLASEGKRENINYKEAKIMGMSKSQYFIWKSVFG